MSKNFEAIHLESKLEKNGNFFMGETIHWYKNLNIKCHAKRFSLVGLL